MANNKVGFIYYNVDTDRYQDIRIKKLKKDFGCCGIAVYDYILCEIYRVKGCFIEWDESTAFGVAEYYGLKESLITEIVAYCCSVGLFDKGVLAREKVLTSKSIQSRFIEMSKKAKRNLFIVPEKITIVREEEKIIQEESHDYSTSLPQSKVEQSKEEKSKVNKRRVNSLVVSDETTHMQNELQKKYSNEFVPSIAGKSTGEIWEALKAWISENKPEFIDPFVDVWNVFATNYKLAKMISIPDARRKKFAVRVKEPEFNFFEILKFIKQSDFLKGTSNDNSTWKVDFDFIIESQKNYIKILEGKYK